MYWFWSASQIAKFMGPTWGPNGACRPQMGPMLVPWILPSGLTYFCIQHVSAHDGVWSKGFWTSAQLSAGDTWTWPDGTLVNSAAQPPSSSFLYIDPSNPSSYFGDDGTTQLHPRCQASRYYISWLNTINGALKLCVGSWIRCRRDLYLTDKITRSISRIAHMGKSYSSLAKVINMRYEWFESDRNYDI